jgi:catechol 2,3-dioxygenase-like lactoylglutathione lyase family enzyme
MTRMRMGTAAGLMLFALGARAQTELPAPGFHHLHLNSTNPDAAIDFYAKQFPSASRTTFAGLPALKIGKAYILFTKVDAPPPVEPQTAIWHFGWHVTDVRANMERYKATGVKLLPLITSPEGGEVFINSDTWPGTGGTLGRTKSQIEEAKAQGIKPAGGGGFAYLQGPDRAIVEYQGNMPAERFNHVHMYQEDPVCAQLWYVKNLGGHAGGRGPQRSEADCKIARGEPGWPALDPEGTIRTPSGGVTFDDVSLQWYARPGKDPLVSTRGHLADHVALSVTNLDAWVGKLRTAGIKFLGDKQDLGNGNAIIIDGMPTLHMLGNLRSVMIEGPSREAIELVEIK